MPIIVQAHHSLEQDNLRTQLEQLYGTSPEFSDGLDAVEQLEYQLAQHTVVYTAEFNSKIIGAIWCTEQDESRLLQYIVIHPANRGRGVAERLVSEVCRLEEQQGITHFQPGCGAIQRCLTHIGKLSS